MELGERRRRVELRRGLRSVKEVEGKKREERVYKED
jgi:hypothetical protein